jgi:uncharacterized membrane protein YfcA
VTPAAGIVLLVAAFCAGAVNAVAGGGTLLTFPALLSAGLGPLNANATSTVALVPGSAGSAWAFRDALQSDRRVILAMTLPSLVGGGAGTLLALRLGDEGFAAVVPWLVLGATALFIGADPLRRRLGAVEPVGPLGLAAFQLPVAIYGGFFGAGIGILMLASLALSGEKDLHRMNALKNLAAVCINGVSAATFLASGRVQLLPALAMAAAAIAGGQFGAGTALRIGQDNVRRVVIAVGLGMAAWMFVRRFA